MNPSIRTFLLINLLLGITLITSLAIIGNLFIEHKDLQDHLDSQLLLMGTTIQALISNNLNQNNLQQIQQEINRIPSISNQLYYKDHGHSFAPLDRTVQFKILDKDNNLLLKSRSAPKVQTTQEDEIGFKDKWIDDKPWRMFATYNPHTGIKVIVAERYDFRQEIESRITQDSIFIMLITYPFFGILIWIIVGRGLDTIKRVAKELSERAHNYLEPMAMDSIPIEIQPLVDELNRLLTRLKEAFNREKRFAADAAHELRTPLAALKAQAQVALKAIDPEERNSALKKVLAGVDRSTHVVQQLLTLSRMVPQAITQEFETVDVSKQSADVISMIASQAISKNTDIELVSPETPATIMGYPTAIGILIRNLVDNAIRYTPNDSWVKVIVETDAENVILRVIDNGAGIPVEMRERVFERFFRVLGTQSPGSGLGLGIVQQIASIHHATISLETPPSGLGLEVRVVFPKRQ